MSYQSEAQLENDLVQQLVGQGFALARISDGADLFLNLKAQLEAFNAHHYSDREFKKILNHLGKGNFFPKGRDAARPLPPRARRQHLGLRPVF